MVFQKHYTRDEARDLLPSVREWLDQLIQLRQLAEHHEKPLRFGSDQGRDVGGDSVNRWIRVMADIKDVLYQFQSREIQIKDLDRGLIDFPAFIGGREVFLCWEKCEDDISYWHELDSGFAGREPI